MTRTDKIKRIQELLANKAGQFLAYKTWPDDFCRQELNELSNEIVKQLGRVSLEGLTKDEADMLGFGRWDEESSLRLAPIWLYPFLTPGEKLHSISGDSTIVGEDYTNHDATGYIDNDQRGGYLAYGVMAA